MLKWTLRNTVASPLYGLTLPTPQAHVTLTQKPIPEHTGGRHKRSTSPGGALDPHVYIDSIGVPRGVPDDFKARDEVAAGFESLILIITVNKNVAWINYIYYNQQRFVNYTRDALFGVADQLNAASQMTFQNRIALDMILAEKGGTCVYIDKVQGCCTYIPNSTGPDGKVTLAIQKLQDLSVELKQNSGVNDPWSQYFGWFNNWKQALINIALFLVFVLMIILLVGCCILPCIRKALEKGIGNLTLYTDSSSDHDDSPDGYARYLVTYRNKRARTENHII